MSERHCKKIIVEVEVRFQTDGKMLPRQITWEDGRHFAIDKIVDIRRAASLKAGGHGVRYTCRIEGKEKFLFFEDPIWFVEGK